MSDTNKSVIEKYIAAGHAQDWDLTSTFHADGWIQHNPDGTQITDDSYKDFVSVFFAAFPDLQSTIHEQIAEGDSVVTRVTWSGTHTGEFMGLPATGNQVDLEVIRIDRVTDGKIAESRAVFDSGAMMRQLGIAG